MAVTRRSFNTNQNASGATTLVITKPSGTATNDLLIASVIANADNLTPTISTGGAAWIQLGNHLTNTLSGTGTETQSTWYKIVTDGAAEPASYTITYSASRKAAGAVVAYQGVDTTNPIASWVQNNYFGYFNLDYYAGVLGAYMEAPYNPSFHVGFVGTNQSTTFTAAGMTTEVFDITSGGGGGATTKVTFAGYETPTPLIYTYPSNDPTYPGRRIISSSSSSVGAIAGTAATSNGETSVGININASGSTLIGPPATFDGSSSMVELITGPFGFTDGINVNTGQTMGGSSPSTETSLFTAYHVTGTDYVAGFYSEYHGTGPRQQEGRVHVWKQVNTWTKWSEIQNRFIFQNQSDGATPIDVTRIRDNRFVVLWSEGHAWAQGGNENSYWLSSTALSVIDVNTSTGVPTSVGSSFWSTASGSAKNPYLGDISRLGPNAIVGWISQDGAPDTYWFLVSTIAENGTVTRGTPVALGGTTSSGVFVSHVDGTKAVGFYWLNSTTWSARVLNVSGTAITLGATTYSLPSNKQVYSEAAAFSATKGVYLQEGATNKDLNLVPYTISGDTITFGTAYTAVSEASALSEQRMIKLANGKLCISYIYGTTVNLKYFTFNTTTEAFAAAGVDNNIGLNSTAYYKGKVTEASNRRVLHIYADASTPIAYVNAREQPVSTLTDNHNAYISYAETFAYAPVKSGYIRGHIAPTISPKNLYMNATERQIVSSKTIYLNGAAYIIDDNTPSYIRGHKYSQQSMWLYLHGGGFPTSSKNAFIMSGAQSASKTLFLNATRTESDSQSAYIQSVTQMLFGKLMYMNGSPLVSSATEYGALSFDKTKSQRVEFNDNKFYNGLEKMTINLWVKTMVGTSGAYDMVIGKAYTTGTKWTIALFRSAVASKYHFGMTNSAGTWTANDSTVSYTVGVWQMATIVFDGTNCNFYLNGVFSNQYAVSGPPLVDSQKWYMAFRHDNSTYTTIDIADVTIWDYAVDAATITSMYLGLFVKSGQSCFVGVTITTPKVGNTHAYINSSTSSSNFLTVSDVQRCVITGGVSIDNQSIYLVGGDITTETWDTKIIIDDFREETFDLLIRFVVQGERARRFQDADVVYPISRVRYRDLPNIFYPDIPGRIFDNQQAYIHSGYFIDTHTGDLSGTNSNIQPKIQRVYITRVQFNGEYHRAYIPGAFTAISGTKAAFIMGAPTENVKAYISGTTINEINERQYSYIFGTAGIFNGLVGRMYIKPRDSISSSRAAQVIRPGIDRTYHNAFINSVPMVPKASQRLLYMKGAGGVTRNINLYMNAHLSSISDSQNCFIHAKRADTVTKNCFIKAPFAYYNNVIQRVHMMTRDNMTDSQSCYIFANRNILDNHLSYIYGRKIFESSRRAYIVATPIIYTTSDSTLAFINAPTPISSSRKCLINAGVTDPKTMAYIYNRGNLTDRVFCYVNGPAISDNNLSYIFGHFVKSGSLPSYISA